MAETPAKPAAPEDAPAGAPADSPDSGEVAPPTGEADSPSTGAEAQDVPEPAAVEGSPPAGPPVLTARRLTISVAGQVLVEDASFEIQRGEVVLLVGPSGAGKSVLLKLLTGLIDPTDAVFEMSGEVKLDGVPVLGVKRSREVTEAFRKTGIVFQDHALFDALSVGQNVAFARDHSHSEGAAEAAGHALSFLAEAGIRAERAVQGLSGGQRQRVAIARTFAADPELVVYDEPTSALDPRASRKVAELIRHAGQEFHKTALIVSHDYEPFSGLVSRVLFLDPAAKALREIPFADLAAVMADAKAERAAEPEAPAGGAGEHLRAAGGAVAEAMETTWSVVEGLIRSAPWLAPRGAKPRWLANYAWHYIRLTFWGSAIPYMIIAGVIVGFVVTYFTFTRLPQGQHFQDEILPVLGVALWRVVIPVLTTLLIAGRTGAALASDLGNRVLNKEVLAMRGFGLDERPYLLTPMLWANAIGTLLLDLICFLTASVTSLIVFTLTTPERTPFFWSTYYFAKLQPLEGAWLPPKSELVLCKLLACSLVTAAVSWRVGTSSKRSGAAVSFGTTTTVYWSTVAVLIVHFIFAFFEFDKPARF